MEKYIASIDQGTTSTRCLIFNKIGDIIGSSQKEHTQKYPEPGWVEHEPLEIWNSTENVIRDAIASSSIKPEQISAIGITNQRETTIVWDKNTGRPVYNAIVWQDTRTKQLCDQLALEGGLERFRSITGLPLAPYFSATKIKWILDHIPGARTGAENGSLIFGNIDTWLIWWLTGGPGKGSHITDVTNASRTLLMNIHSCDWDEELLGIFENPQTDDARD